MIVVPILAIASTIAVVWSAYKYQTAYVALIDALPPQFQDGLNSKFAFPEYVLRSTTPLPTQADYVESLVGFCCATLGIALLCFLYENQVVGAIVFVMFIAFSFLTIRSWKVYRANCSRQPFQDGAQ
ncbi:hypothetical protein [uncultured Bradyrhizobium sp.]|uniref:hypothetical protein n=1 Tax=uncultured Bradyrhizobium sp. TaxID=199684 RepID=UPI0026270D1A|nr:hypothetical protein [uncultured Bradyrhizobium sp.]